MWDDLNPSEVEIVTRSYAITGRCRGLTEQVRLIDLLNIDKFTHLQLTHVTVREFVGSREVISGEGLYLIDKSYVVFGRSIESPEKEARRRESRHIDFVERAKQQMLVFASPFRILGYLHTIRGADFAVALPRQFEGFVAITDAHVVHETESAEVWTSSFIAVNGRHIEIVCPSPPEDWTDPLGRLVGFQPAPNGAGKTKRNVRASSQAVPAPSPDP